MPICHVCREDTSVTSEKKRTCKKSKLKTRIAELEKEFEAIKGFPNSYYNEVEVTANLFARINYALAHCQNNQDGKLCDVCYMLENGVPREDDSGML
jgi:hypothetical protein